MPDPTIISFSVQDGWETPIRSFTMQAVGLNGREIELQKSATHVQWRYVGAATWTNLIALADLEGEPGAPGSDATVTAAAVQAAIQADAAAARTAMGAGEVGAALFQAGDAAAALLQLGEIVARCATQSDNAGGGDVDIAGMTGIALTANTTYLADFFGYVTCGGGGYNFQMVFNQSLSPAGVASGNGVSTRTNGAVGGVSQNATTIFLNGLTGSVTQGVATSRYMFRTGAVAPTAKFLIRQNTTPSGTTSALVGTTAILKAL